MDLGSTQQLSSLARAGGRLAVLAAALGCGPKQATPEAAPKVRVPVSDTTRVHKVFLIPARPLRRGSATPTPARIEIPGGWVECRDGPNALEVRVVLPDGWTGEGHRVVCPTSGLELGLVPEASDAVVGLTLERVGRGRLNSGFLRVGDVLSLPDQEMDGMRAGLGCEVTGGVLSVSVDREQVPEGATSGVCALKDEAGGTVSVRVGFDTE